MKRQEYITDFSTLKSAYNEVKSFLEEETFDKVTSLATTIENDLGCAGDDNYELLIKFSEKYNLNTEDFDYSAHFLSEGELFDSTSIILQLLQLPLYILKVVTFGKVNILPPHGYFYRETSDLTFGDMIAWYLSKDFKHRRDLNIQLVR